MPSLVEFGIFAFITGAILIRITANRKMVDAYRERYNRFPDWRWMWTPVADPAIEKLRRQALLGPVFAIAGLVLLFYVIVTGAPPPG